MAELRGGNITGSCSNLRICQNKATSHDVYPVEIVASKQTTISKIIKKDKQLDIHDVREALVLCGKPARPVSPEFLTTKLTLLIIDYAAQKEIKDVCMNYFIVIVGLLHVYHHTRFKTLTPPP